MSILDGGALHGFFWWQNPASSNPSKTLERSTCTWSIAGCSGLLGQSCLWRAACKDPSVVTKIMALKNGKGRRNYPRIAPGYRAHASGVVVKYCLQSTSFCKFKLWIIMHANDQSKLTVLWKLYNQHGIFYFIVSFLNYAS